jgi:hypothetical protein
MIAQDRITTHSFLVSLIRRSEPDVKAADDVTKRDAADSHDRGLQLKIKYDEVFN